MLKNILKNPYVPFILAMLIFGSNGIVASHIPLSSYETVLCRTLLGGLFLLPFVFAKHQFGLFAKHKRATAWLVLAGAFLALNWIFLYEAYKQIGVSLATIMCFCGPVLTMILARFVFNEAFTVPKVVGIIAVVIGMVCINGADFQANGLSWGMICGILSAVGFAFLVIAMKKTDGLVGPLASCGQLLVASVFIAVVAYLTHSGPINLDATAICWILLLGVFNTGVGYFCYLSGIQRLPAQSVSVCSYVEPVAALAFSFVFLGEMLTGLQWIGVALILGGVSFAELFHRHA